MRSFDGLNLVDSNLIYQQFKILSVLNYDVWRIRDIVHRFLHLAAR